MQYILFYIFLKIIIRIYFELLTTILYLFYCRLHGHIVVRTLVSEPTEDQYFSRTLYLHIASHQADARG